MGSTAPLPSLSSSPHEEDLSRTGAWIEASSSGESSSGLRKGKEKESDQETLHSEEEGDEAEGEEFSGADGYPPTKEEEAESRRIEENLQKWETAERERRKAARQSTTASGGGSTLVSDITRRASLLWPSGRAKQASLGGVGAHHRVRTAEDGVPLDDIEGSPAITPAPSPEPGDNPFATPAASTLSLNNILRPAIMTASSSMNPFEPHGNGDDASPTTPTAKRSTLEASSSSSRQPPPPEPLDLPRPRTPPPRTETPHANRPPEPIPPPTVAPPQQEEEPPAQTRWWTEWLCGCSEGPDRGGDHQAARTNPLE